MRSTPFVTFALAILAASVVASGEPPHPANPSSGALQRYELPTLPLPSIDGAPRTMSVVLAPPGLTPTIRDSDCAFNPYETLRTDCRNRDDEDTHVWHGETAANDSRNPADPDRAARRATISPRGGRPATTGPLPTISDRA